MKYSVFLLIIAVSGCKPTPEFYIHGKAYYTEERCVQYDSHSEVIYSNDFNPALNSYVLTPHQVVVSFCVKTVIDTIEIKK